MKRIKVFHEHWTENWIVYLSLEVVSQFCVVSGARLVLQGSLARPIIMINNASWYRRVQCYLKPDATLPQKSPQLLRHIGDFDEDGSMTWKDYTEMANFIERVIRHQKLIRDSSLTSWRRKSMQSTCTMWERNQARAP